MREELLKGLTDEQVVKVRACENASDLLQLAKDEGVDLSEEQLEAVSGGACDFEKNPYVCKYCGHDNSEQITDGNSLAFLCQKCHRLNIK